MALLLICFISFFSQPALSIEPDVNFSHLDVKDGLSQSTVLSIHQDVYGFMWIGTRDGLNRYDTYSFTAFRPQAGDSTSISGHIIYAIAEDAEHQIWVVTQNGLSRYDRKSNRFENYEIRSSSINTLYIDKKNRIWVGGAFGLLKFDVSKKEFYEPEVISKTQDSFNVYAIKEDAKGNLWIGTDQFGLYCFNPEKNSWLNIPIDYRDKIESRIEGLLINEGIGLWMGTYGDGLFQVDFSGKVMQHYHQNGKANQQLSNNNIRSLIKDNKDNIWIGTFDGLNILDTLGNTTLITYNENNLKGLSHSSIRSLYKDEKGSVWIGTYFGGLNVYDDDNQRFKHYLHLSGDENSLSFDVIGAFSEDDSGNIYIGTERGGLNVYNPKTRIHNKAPKNSLENITIKSLCYDNNNNLWLGVFKRGLNLYNPTNESLQPFPQNQRSHQFLSTAIINDIMEDDEGNLWIATDSKGGIHKFNPRTKKYIDFPHQKNIHQLLKYTAVKSIAALDNNTFALATKAKGIVLFNLTTGMIEEWNSFKIDDRLINIEEFNHVYLDKKQNMWMASGGAGLLKYNFEKEAFHHYGTSKGLSNNIVQGVLEDKQGEIWAITLNGLDKIDVERDTIPKNYINSSGLPLTEINEGAFYKTTKNEFLIGGNNGYISFDPTELRDNRYIPKMAFTALEIKNETVLPNDDSGILKQELNETKKITLSYFQSVLTMEFVALSYHKSQNNHYSYKLEGFDEDWIYTKNKPRVTYTNLRKGEYTFYAKGANNDGIWNDEPLMLQIKILPPPWQTWWAYSIYTLLILGGFYVIRRNGIKSALLRHNLETEQLEKEKWKEIHDLKLKYFMDVSHEFRTPLTLIAAPLEEMLDKEQSLNEKKRSAKTMYINVKRLQLLVDQILELRALEIGHSHLNLQPLDLSKHIEEIIDSFKALADKKEIKLDVKKDNLPLHIVMADTTKLDKIFFNLLSNAFKFTPSGGEIQLTVSAKKKQDSISYNFILKDTGIGIEPELLPDIFDRFTKKDQDGSGTGIGLALTKSLVELMRGSIKVESLSNMGTTFFINIDFDIAAQWDNEKIITPSYSSPIPLESLDYNCEEPDDENSQKTKILVVEDHEELRSYLKAKLKNDYKVYTANNGQEGLERAQKVGPEIIITDVMMPKMDGIEFCRAIKTSKELCHIPVIMLTAKVSQDSKMKGFETGADVYLSKPFNLQELLLRIKNILRDRKLLQLRYKNLSTPYLSDEQLLNPQDEQLMTSILHTIKENLDKPNFTVEFLSSEVGLSRVHLFRKLKNLTGMSPTEFIRDIRMQNAFNLLKTQKYKPSDVAYMVGFQDAAYFGKCFKKYAGMSPSEYIKSQ